MAVAGFQKVPEWYVSDGLIKLAFMKLSEGGSKIRHDRLITFTRMVQPMTSWRILKTIGKFGLDYGEVSSSQGFIRLFVIHLRLLRCSYITDDKALPW